ncbi:MAG: SapC family protein [Emcibacter sp.]|nr:SapC family protein [Emcibacter sp.]
MTKKDKTAANQTNQKAGQQEQNFPVLYNQIVPLLKNLHKDLKLQNNQKFDFAANMNAVPIVMQELPMAAKFFPIVFTADEPITMLAVLGIRKEQNLFVDENGDWQANSYVPTYIRRYPFFIAKPDENSEPIICIDDTSPFFSPDGDVALFKDGTPTDELNRIMDFARNYEQQLKWTNEFVQALSEKDMLENQRASFKEGEDVKANVDGFKAISRPKFDDLDGETLKEWLGKNWLDASILHQASGSNFDSLWRMDRKRNG